MSFIKNFCYKATSKAKNEETSAEAVFKTFYEGNLNRFFLMRDRNRTEEYSVLEGGVYRKILLGESNYNGLLIKTDEKGRITQKSWDIYLETFVYDERGYVTLYECYGNGVLLRKEETIYNFKERNSFDGDMVSIAEVTNTFYEEGKENKVIRDVYQYLDNGKMLTSQRFFTNIPFDEIENNSENNLSESYLAYEQTYGGQRDTLKRRIAYDNNGKVREVSLYTQSSNDNNSIDIENEIQAQYSEECKDARFFFYYSPLQLDIDYNTIRTFEKYGLISAWGDIILANVTLNAQGRIEKGYVLDYEGANFENSGDWPKMKAHIEREDGEVEMGYEYDWRGYTWRITLFEKGDSYKTIESDVRLSINEAVYIFMPAMEWI